MRKTLLFMLLAVALAAPAVIHGCGGGTGGGTPGGGPAFDPIAIAQDSIGKTVNFEAVIPAMCYTKTDGTSNACWVCHTESRKPNDMQDHDLQREYAFSGFALTNRWDNLFRDRTDEVDAITDDEILAWIREDNYTPLYEAMKEVPPAYSGWRPDLDFRQGFDDEGFARDGSNWRAFRFKPFLGSFWPTNGNTDDVMIRLPERFRMDAQGTPSRMAYKINLAIVDLAIQGDPFVFGDDWSGLEIETEPLDESVAGIDLDGDGEVGGMVTRLRGLPSHYVGAARDIAVHRFVYPEGTAFLHTVRYVDPDAPAFISQRMKEVRYMKKHRFVDSWGLQWNYRKELEEKADGQLPQFTGTPLTGINNPFGWRLTGFIEDEEGRLRLQTEEEHRFCMGCHSTVGVTVDSTFSFARKVPGADGWRYQDPAGIKDVPQAGHDEPEYLTYFKRVRGGDEFRANTELLDRFFPGGVLDEAEVLRAARDGDQDITHLILPSRDRALRLDKAYLAIVRSQRYDLGRDTILTPINVHEEIENGSTRLARTDMVFKDGRLWLDWEGVAR